MPPCPCRRAISIFLAVFLIGTSVPSVTSGAARAMARLDGQPIPVTRMARLHCHDLDGGAFRCFRTGRALTVDLGRMIARRRRTGSPRLLAVSYIHLYEHEGYGGASVVLSQDYPNLSTIGWNDRMTSFKVLNGGDGSMHKDAQYTSGTYAFCCGTQVSNIGATWNDAVSSIHSGA